MDVGNDIHVLDGAIKHAADVLGPMLKMFPCVFPESRPSLNPHWYIAFVF